MHTYDSDDTDNFICDDCDSEIRGDVFNAKGNMYRSRNVARSGKEHYCEDCTRAKEVEA